MSRQLSLPLLLSLLAGGGMASAAGPVVGTEKPEKEVRPILERPGETSGSHWAFQPPRLPPLPSVRDRAWSRSPIDVFVRARQEQAGIAPVAQASPTALVRRLHFDLTGLPPTPEAEASFLSEHARDPGEALAREVDRLLASPHFGEHWGRHWLDVARYAETTGATNDLFLVDAWRYRDYVVAAFNADLPYDRFVAEQLAGDLLPASTPRERDRQVIATGFLALGPHDHDRPDPLARMDQIDEQIDVTTKAFLGLTVACARCHDHKYDPVSQKEYYALAGIFSSTEVRKTAVHTRGKHTLVKVTTGLPLEGYRQEPVDEMIRLQEDLYAGRNPVVRMGWERNRLRAAAGKAGDPSEAARLSAAAERIQKAMDERTRKSREARQLLAELPPLPPMALGVCDGARPHDQTVRIRGEVDQKGETVPRGFLRVLSRASPPRIPEGSSGRLQLARWIASADNPTTARVLVNRVWCHLLGKGLAPDVDNLGVNGEPPTHPELLDWLAVRFVEEGWSIKKLVRWIVLSRVYRLSTEGDAAAERVDADNTLLWRRSRRRLGAEEIRDAILAFSGQLDRSPRARSQIAELGVGAMRFDGGKIDFTSSKRALYLPRPRGRQEEVLRLFDGADPRVVVGQRDVTTVASQALFLMNSPFVRQQAELAARRLLESPAAGTAERIDLAFRMALGRPPGDRDRRIARRLLASVESADPANPAPALPPELRAWSALCQVLIGSPEFRYLH